MSIIKGEFNYLESEPYTPATYHYTYDESWLELSPKEAPFDMLRFSLCLAMAASKEKDITNFFDQLGYKYTNNINYEKENLNVLAGAKVTDSVYYPAQEIDGICYYNSIAYAIGSKEVGDSTVIIVAIRGGNYGLEWGSNFSIGAGTDFEGFSIAADQVLDGLKYYIDSNNIKNKIKVWTVGYSRAAATANLVSSRLVKGEVEGVEAENVYSFGFECPRTTRSEDALDEKYDGIISVANPDDIVPKLAMSVWGYKRYGRTLFLPSYQTDKNYPQKRAIMLETVKETKSNDKDPAQNDDFTVTQFIEDLALAARDPENYVKLYQSALVKLVGIYLGGAKARPTKEEFVALGELEKQLISIDPENASFMKELFGSRDGNLFMISPSCPLLRVHYMANTFAWIESFKNYYNFGENKVRIIYINNGLNITAVNKADEIVAQLEEGRILKMENSLYSRIDQNDQFIIVCPANEEIKIKIDKAKDNDLSLMIQEYDLELGLPTKIIDYAKVDTDNTNAVATLPNLDESDKYELSVDNKAVEPKNYLEGNEVKNFTILPVSSGKGEVLGGGYYTIGEYSQVTAISKDNKFIGWFVDEELVSDKEIYRFPVTKSLQLIAKFE